MATNHPLSPNGVTHVLLDTNILLPPRLSDIIFDLALQGLFSARWSEHIETEFLRNWPRVVANVSGDLSPQQQEAEQSKAERRLSCYQGAIGSYEVFGNDAPSVLNQVPSNVHHGDKHVAAAGLVLHQYAEAPHDKVFIVSSNTKHLAVVNMRALGVEVVKPGKFIDLLSSADPGRVEKALQKSISSLKNPPITHDRLLETLRLHGAAKTATHFEQVWKKNTV